MTAVELLSDEPDWRFSAGTAGFASFGRTGRLRVWRDESGRLIGMLSIRRAADAVPGSLDDDACVIPDQIRAGFPGQDMEIFAYEPGWWGCFAAYYRADRTGDGTQRWEYVDWRVLSERLGAAFVYDEDEDTSPGAG